jgi:hypothetical protein
VIVFDKLGAAADIEFYITNITNPDDGDADFDPEVTTYTCPNPAPNDYCLKIDSSDAFVQGVGNNKATLYFAVKPEQTSDLVNFGNVNRYNGYILIFGKYCPQSDPKNCSGLKYAQNLPFIAVEAT